MRFLPLVALVCGVASCSLFVDTSGLQGGGGSGSQDGGGSGEAGADGGGPCASCDDQNPCTDDTCDDAGTCHHAANTGTCDDGDTCTNGDACSQGTCFGGAADTTSSACKPIPVDRSVGPQNTTPVASSAATKSTLTIAGTTALFGAAMPDNFGMGDAVLYDTNDDGTVDAIAFVHARVSSTVYQLRAKDGTTPAAVTTSKTWAAYRAYLQLADAVHTGTENASIDPSLANFDDWTGGTNLNGIAWSIACYADGFVDSTSAGICSASTNHNECDNTNGGWSTTNGGYLRIFTPSLPSEVGTSQRHKGRWGEGYQRTASIIFGPGLDIRVEGMSIHQTTTDRTYLILAPGDGGHVRIAQSFSWAVQRAFDVWDGSLAASSGPDTIEFWNDIGINDTTTDGAGAFYINSSHVKAEISSCTGVAHASGEGAFTDPNSVTSCRNCLAVQDGSAVGFSGTFGGVSTSASTDATVGSYGATNSASVTPSFVAAGSQDFHLVTDASQNVGIRGKGANLGTSFTTDIDGDPRPASGAWDIGADQVP